MILVGAELMEDFSDDLKVFRGIEEVRFSVSFFS